jgi:hypothetical protein
MLCKKIKKQGGAEQYNANKKCSEAVAVAVEECADDTKGQTCFICTQALHWKTKEGLVRGCACRGTAGFAHVSCLAEQAKILVEEADENNLSGKAKNERWDRWSACSMCEQRYHGVVACALGWACWKTYVGLPETDGARSLAIGVLGNGLQLAKHHEDALSVYEAELSMRRRVGSSEYNIVVLQSNLAHTYEKLGRLEEALPLRRDVFFGFLKLCGIEHEDTLGAAYNCATSLLALQHFGDVKSLLRDIVPVARRTLGSHELTLRIRWLHAEALYKDPAATLDDLREAVATLEEIERIARRVLGGAHPLTEAIEHNVEKSRAALRARETPSGST